MFFFQGEAFCAEWPAQAAGVPGQADCKGIGDGESRPDWSRPLGQIPGKPRLPRHELLWPLEVFALATGEVWRVSVARVRERGSPTEDLTGTAAKCSAFWNRHVNAREAACDMHAVSLVIQQYGKQRSVNICVLLGAPFV